MEVFEWKDNAKAVFVRRRSIEEGKKKLYSVFKDQCGPSLKTKLKVTKGYNNYHNAQYGIKLLDLIRSIICGGNQTYKEHGI